MIDTRPLVAGLLSIACAEPCLAQLQGTTPLPISGSWLPSALQQYNPASELNNLLPSLKGTKPGGKAQLQQRTYPFRPGNNPTAANKPKRNLKVGPCALPFMENCVVGPYVSAAFSLASNTLAATNSSANSYPATSNRNPIDTSSTHAVTTSSSGLAGADVAFGYDFGGIRTELSYSFSTGNTGSLNISGSDIYTSTSAPGVTVPMSASANSGQASFTRQALLLNAALDLPTGTRLIPYFGGGIGAGWISLGSINEQTSDFCTTASAALGRTFASCPATFNSSGGTGTALAAQAKAGLSYLINLRTIMFLEAVYDYTGAVTIGNLNLNSFSQYSGKLGVRYRF